MDGSRMSSCNACGSRGVGPGEAPYDEMGKCVGCDDTYCLACLTNGACEDPDCQAVAAEAAKLESEVQESESNWLRTLALNHPVTSVFLNQEKE